MRLEEIRQLDYNRQEAIAADKVAKLAGVKNAEDLVGCDNIDTRSYTSVPSLAVNNSLTQSTTPKTSSPSAVDNGLKVFEDVILSQDTAKATQALQRRPSGASIGVISSYSPRDKVKSGALSSLFDSTDEDDGALECTESPSSPPRPKTASVAVTLPTMLFRASTPNIVLPPPLTTIPLFRIKNRSLHRYQRDRLKRLLPLKMHFTMAHWHSTWKHAAQRLWPV